MRWTLLFILSVAHVCLCQLETVTVTSEQGELRGKVATTVRGLEYYSFQGIPYAKAPVGPLRFKAPEPTDPWEGTIDALEQGPVCPQTGSVITEDCLFVNVYSTYLPENPSENLRPVLVWIHGGGYAFGSGNIEQQGPDYLLEEDIVVVTLNYRLGALGFLSLQGTEVSSNNGLKDQSLALRWVQQNIAHFGGDPSRVTIWGESAGAGSVHGQMLSPMSQGLFHQVISESGSVLSPWSLYAPGAARESAFRLGEALGTTTNDTTVLIEALRSATAQEIIDASLFAGSFTVDVENEVAPGDEAFLPASPWELIVQGKYSDVPLLIGTNAQEGIGFALQSSEAMEYYNDHLEELLPWQFGGSKEVAAKVKEFYFGGKNISHDTAVQFGNLQTDLMFLHPVDSQVKLQSAVSSTPLFYYLFSFDGLLGWDRRSQGDVVPGVPHADELGYIFYTSYNDPGFPSDRPEMMTLARVVKMWTNFVKTGNPTPSEDPLLQNVTWSPFTKLDHFYLDIGKDLTVRRDVANDRLGFLTDIYSTLNITM